MFEWLNPIVNQIATHADDIIVIQMGFLCIVTTIFLWLWHSNRKKYNNLKHAIPADVVKSYLDSIIMNSTSLKSQLFRGGGLDVGGVPSVLPLQNLIGGEGLAISGAPSTALMEELNQKKAQIAALESQLSSGQTSRSELESKLTQSNSSLTGAQAKIKELEALLAQNRDGGGGDAALKAELNMVSKERDDLLDRLKEFEIIADDLANLKRLQQENEQLKRSLAAQGGQPFTPTLAPEREVAVPKTATAEVSESFEEISGGSEASGNDNKALDEFLNTPDATPGDDFDSAAAAFMSEDPLAKASTEEESLTAAPEAEALEAEALQAEALEAEAAALDAEAAAPEAEAEKSKPEKTPEDLLSEFEKMLG